MKERIASHLLGSFSNLLFITPGGRNSKSMRRYSNTLYNRRKKGRKRKKKKKNKFDVLRNRVHLDEERFADHADLPYLKRIPWRRARARRTQMSPEGARGRTRARRERAEGGGGAVRRGSDAQVNVHFIGRGGRATARTRRKRRPDSVERGPRTRLMAPDRSDAHAKRV